MKKIAFLFVALVSVAFAQVSVKTDIAGGTLTGSFKVGDSSHTVQNASGTPLSSTAFSGIASGLTTGHTIGITGDLVWTSPTFDGTGNVTAAGTLATVNSNVGTFGSATQSLSVTFDAKGRATGVTAQTVTPAWSSITSKPTTLSGFGITDAQPLSTNLTALSAVTIASDSTAAAGNDTTSIVQPSGLRAREQVYAATQASIQNRIRTRLATGRPASVLHYGDSLVNGSTSGCYNDYFKPAWYRVHGPSGRGFINFETNQIIGSGMLSGSSATSLAYNFNPGTAGWSSQSTGTASGNFAYSFSGIGTYVTAAAGTEAFYIQDSLYPFTRVTLFYLVQPGGGTFDFGKDGSLTTVSTASATTGVASITLSIWGTTPTDNILCVKNLTGGGSFYFFGLDFETTTRGGASYKGGVGGVSTQTEASLNATAFGTYLAALNPAVVTLCLGQNDIGSRSAAQYQTDLTTIVSRIQAWDPSCPIIFEVPTSSSSLSSYQTAIANVATATGMQVVWWRDWIGTGTTYLQGDGVHPNTQGCAILADGLLDLFSSKAPLPADTQNPYPNPDAYPSLLNTPTSDGTFTAGTTNWAGSNSGTATLDTTNHWLTCTSAGTFSGVKLTNANYGGNMTTGGLYYIRIGVTAPASGSLVVYDGSGNVVHLLNGAGSVSATGTYEFYFYAANGATFNDIRVYCSSASQTWTITSFDVRRLIVNTIVTAGQATGFTIQGGTPNATLTVKGDATVGDATVPGSFAGFTSSGAGTFTSTDTTGIEYYNTTDQVTNFEKWFVQWSSNIAYTGLNTASGANKRTWRLRNLHGGSATYMDMVTPDGTAPFINWYHGSTSPTGTPIFFKFGDGVGTVGSTSGTITYVGINPVYNEASGSAANTDLVINRTETAVGSGAQKFVDYQVAGSSKYSIDHSGSPKIPSATVSSLPSASTLGAGSMFFVTDLTSITSGGTATGGGSLKHLVVSDGTNWIVQ